jgi:regulator of protease activity HflC (stomatin/prohibitin superfamily)
MPKTDSMGTTADHDDINVRGIVKGLAYGVAGFVTLGILSSGFYTVPQTDRCYVTRFRQVVDTNAGVVGPGLHFKVPVIDQADCLSVSRFTDNLGVVTVTTKDTFTVEMSVGLTAEIPERSVYRLLYQTGRQGSADVAANSNPNIINTLRNIMGKYDLIAIAGEEQSNVRTAFQNAVTEMLDRDFGIAVKEVQLSINKLPQEYNARMVQAQSAQASIVLARRQQEQARIDAETKVIAAQGAANTLAAEADGQRRQRETLAAGEARARQLQAEAEANAIRVQGEAQADAAARMGEAISKNPQLVALEQARKWNGALPQNMYGSVPLPLLNLQANNAR